MDVGINPDLDYLYDPQQRPDPPHLECSRCGHWIYVNQPFWRLSIRKTALTICEDCKSEMEDSEEIFELEELKNG